MPRISAGRHRSPRSRRRRPRTRVVEVRRRGHRGVRPPEPGELPRELGLESLLGAGLSATKSLSAPGRSAWRRSPRAAASSGAAIRELRSDESGSRLVQRIVSGLQPVEGARDSRRRVKSYRWLRVRERGDPSAASASTAQSHAGLHWASSRRSAVRSACSSSAAPRVPRRGLAAPSHPHRHRRPGTQHSQRRGTRRRTEIGATPRRARRQGRCRRTRGEPRSGTQ